MGRDPHQIAALPHRLPHAGEVGVLKIAEPAMNRLEVIERRAASEVALVDERDR